MKKFKLTKDTEKALKVLAGKLPKHEYYAYKYEQVTGKQILKDNPDAKLEDGGKINPNGKYVRRKPIKRLYDHEKRLKNAFKRAGMEGVEKYIQPYIKKETPAAPTAEAN